MIKHQIIWTKITKVGQNLELKDVNNKFLGCNVPCEPILVTMTAVQKSPEGSLQLALLHCHSMKSKLKYTN